MKKEEIKKEKLYSKKSKNLKNLNLPTLFDTKGGAFCCFFQGNQVYYKQKIQDKKRFTTRCEKTGDDKGSYDQYVSEKGTEKRDLYGSW